jgi:hypothetical protein
MKIKIYEDAASLCGYQIRHIEMKKGEVSTVYGRIMLDPAAQPEVIKKVRWNSQGQCFCIGKYYDMESNAFLRGEIRMPAFDLPISTLLARKGA